METGVKQNASRLFVLGKDVHNELDLWYRECPLMSVCQIRIGNLFDSFTVRDSKPNFSDLHFQDKSSFVREIVNHNVISSSIELGLRNHADGTYYLLDKLCHFLKQLGMTADIMQKIVDEMIAGGCNLTSSSYRNVAIIKDRMADPKYVIFGIGQKLGQEMVVYKGVKYYRNTMSKNDRIKWLFKTRKNGITYYLHRQLWEDVFGKIPMNHYIGFKNNDKNAVNIHNLVCLPMGNSINSSDSLNTRSAILKRLHELEKLELNDSEKDKYLLKDWVHKNKSLVREILEDLDRESDM